MRIIFLGTNGWYDTDTGNTVCVLVESKKEYIILDAGYGIYKVDKYIKADKPVYLFLSHFHLDHIIGLHALNKFVFSQGIDIYGPPGLKKWLKTIINPPYSLPFNKLKIKVRLYELRKGSFLPLKMRSLKLKHPSECYGYRFNIEDKILSYCTDTGICRNLFELARGADLFITECSYKPGQSNNKWPHLNPEEAGYVAKKAAVKSMALMHFDAENYPTIKERLFAQAKARKVFPGSYAAKDNMVKEL
ncbi:MAG: MBL fold metallo-hydrolase [Candidatus Omnitrophica bacterium]|nr:MBL fold metallo-hydrolase [Candidatus Omnitrophota bacterium]